MLYIDANKLARVYLETGKELGIENIEFISPKDVHDVILELAENFDEVQPIIHAHQIHVPNPNYSPFDNSSETIKLCSNCNACETISTNYCAYCGAVFDEEQEEL